MGEIRTVTTLRAKAQEITASINSYERKLDQARADLAHINAIIRIFDGSGDPKAMPRYVNLQRLFRRHEKTKLCLEALADGERSTREIALSIMKAKGFEMADSVLAIAITKKLVQTLRVLAQQGKVVTVGKRKGLCVWRLPPQAIPP